MNSLRYAEKQQHGTPDFPLAYYYVDKNHPSYEMRCHWHREMEICYIIKGKFTFTLNGETVEAYEGDTVFIDQGVLHGGIPEDCIYVCIVFDCRTLLNHTSACREYMRFFTSPDVHIDSHFSKNEKSINAITKRLVEASGSIPGNELSTLGSLFEWFGFVHTAHCFTQETNTSLPDESKIQILKPILEYIEQNYMNQINLSDLSKQAGLSTRYFCRFFHTITQHTPMDYLTLFRIEQACSLLTSTNLSVTEVSYRCGFNDTSYFVRVFKKHKAVTPKQYQKQYS